MCGFFFKGIGRGKVIIACLSLTTFALHLHIRDVHVRSVMKVFFGCSSLWEYESCSEANKNAVGRPKVN